MRTKIILSIFLLVGVAAFFGFVISPQTRELIEKGEVLTDSILPDQAAPEDEVLEDEKEELSPTPDLGADTYIVSRVIDGDTIELENGQKLRYIGIDTPETVDPRKGVQCYGKEATTRNKELVEGKTVRLEKDVSDTDSFGRLLRYVYTHIEGGEVLVNDQLVREGFAHSSPYPPDIGKQSLLDEAERDARENNRGLWSACRL